MQPLRNIGIIAHIDAGKTTFSERFLFYSDVIHRMGEVHEGAATMDFLPEEQERGITIASACITCFWSGCAINLVDTPGHVDFTVEVERCLRVLDGAVGIFCAVGGVEPQSETVWRQADGFGIPRLAVINKMDRPGADFDGVLAAIQERLGARPVPVTVPLGSGETFCGVLDLVREERLEFDEASKGREIVRSPFTAEEAALAAPYREALLDALTEDDDNLLELCLSGERPEPEQLYAALRKGTLARKFTPVFAASALRNIGVQPVMDAVARFLPAPEDVPPAAAHDPNEPEKIIPVVCDPSAPVCALAFKVSAAGGRKTVFLRLYAGTLREGDTLLNVGAGTRERVMRLFRLHADSKEALESACAGDIVAVQGFKGVKTGDTLTSGGTKLLLEPVGSFKPVISLALEPKNTEEGERLDEALALLLDEDPTLHLEVNEAAGQRVVSGMGELHLEVLADRIRREFGISPRAGNPQVLCRETVGGQAEAEAEFDRELGGQPHYGKVRLSVRPAERGAGNSVRFNFSGSEEWNKALLEEVRLGITDALSGGLSGNAAEDAEVTVTGVFRKGTLATPAGLHMAAGAALREALSKARPLTLEPLMELTVTVPESFLGGVMSLLGARGARVENLDDRSGLKVVEALAPMRGLFGFATALRSATQGRAGMIMRFARFDTVQG